MKPLVWSMNTQSKPHQSDCSNCRLAQARGPLFVTACKPHKGIGSSLPMPMEPRPLLNSHALSRRSILGLKSPLDPEV